MTDSAATGVDRPELAPGMAAPPQADESGFDINEIVRVLYRRYRTVLAVALAVLVLGVGYTLLQTPVYTATSLVLISPSKERVVAASQDVLQATAPDSASIDSELEVIRSRNLLGQLADELAKTPVPPPPASGIQALLSPLRQLFTKSQPMAAPGDRADPARVTALRREGAINQLATSITTKRRRLSYVIEISAADTNPARAALAANKLAELYMNAQYEARFDAAHRANTWLSERLAGLKTELAAKDAAVEQYRLQTGIITANADDKTTFNSQEASALQTNLVTARADAAEKAVRLRQVEGVMAQGGSPDTIAGVANAGRLNELRKQESEIIQRQADLETKYGELHPAVKKVHSELADVRSQIAGETKRIVASLANESAVSQARLQAMASSSAAAKGTVAANNRSMVRLNELQRDAAATRDVYDNYLKRFQEIADTGSYKANDVRLVANAPTPKAPTSPKIRQSAITFAILGLLAGLGVAFGLERYQDVLSSAEDFERRLGVPALTTMPEVSKAELRKAQLTEQTPAAYVLAKPMSAFAESLRVLRAAILYADIDRKTKTVAITSAMPSEGKTTTSYCLARVASLSGQKVLVVDCDLRRRSLQSFLPEKPTVGLVQVLAGEAQWRDVLHQDPSSGAWILPSAATNFTPQDIFGSVAMGRFLDEVKEQFDLVILDCAPVLAIAETRIVARRADTTVVVAKWGRAPRKAVQAAIRQLNEAGAQVLGVALNGMDPRAGDYGYGYGYRGYGYGKAYAKYYTN